MDAEEEPAPMPGGVQPKYKIVFLGDTFVGKTCIIGRFMYDSFNENYDITIGIDFLSKSMCVDDKVVKLQLWDTAGQERFKSLIPNYLREASAAVVVYDITNRKTFDSVRQWVTETRNLQGDDIKIMLVGNKTDLVDKRQVKTDEGEKLAEELKLDFVETSSKTGSNINELFVSIASSLPGLEGAEITSGKGNVVGSKLKLTQDVPQSATSRGCC
eukprot:TRINITY_DN5026_c0_g1_i24.p1 TRINITY_DN5026_c0_g1~~TRINITY_DN5026_c0_g1_i24.p1  ORF type:complete len:215 (-),score=67.27 TRINITY_DN5026_c0_g1_i24:172-816(-)